MATFTPFKAYISTNGSLALHFIDPSGFWAHKKTITITGNPVINGTYLIGQAPSSGVKYYNTVGENTQNQVMVNTRSGIFSASQAVLFNSLIQPQGYFEALGWPRTENLEYVRAQGTGYNSLNPIHILTNYVNGESIRTITQNAGPNGIIYTNTPQHVPSGSPVIAVSSYCAQNPQSPYCIKANSGPLSNNGFMSNNDGMEDNKTPYKLDIKNSILIGLLVLILAVLVYAKYKFY
jgi:hypothetical protein